MKALLTWWRRREAAKRARAEARHLTKEARRILRRKAAKVPESVATLVRAAVAEVEDATKGQDIEHLRKSITALDDLMDRHLAFARKSAFREYAESIGVAVLVALLLRAFVVEAFQIPSGSMIPTLEVGDHIFVSKFAYGISLPFSSERLIEFGLPKRGDVIVFRFPRDPSVDYIKRVVGLPGDVVEVRSGEVWVNNQPMPRDHVGSFRYAEPNQAGIIEQHDCEKWIENLEGKRHAVLYEDGKNQGENWPPTTVPAGHVFVMGDNRDNSSDSRYWGPVKLDLIKGKALIIWWSRGTSKGMWGLSPSFWESVRWRRFFDVVR